MRLPRSTTLILIAILAVVASLSSPVMAGDSFVISAKRILPLSP